MALEANVPYAIVNRTTGTVLDFTGNNTLNYFVMGWAWHGGANQQWTLAQAIPGVNNPWTLTNGRQVRGYNRFLGIQQGNEPVIPAVGLNSRVCALEGFARHFFIEGGPGDGFRIRTGGGDNPQILANAPFAVTIVTGAGLGHIAPADTVPNINDNGAPLILAPVAQAQVWDFIPVADMPVLRPGIYTIRNNTTGTVLDFSGNVALAVRHVTGWESHGGANQQWTLTLNAVTGLYRFQINPGDDVRFLAPEVDPVPAAGTRLVGQVGAALAGFTFNIRRVPGTHDYHISTNVDGVNFAVNIVSGAGFVPPPQEIANLTADGPPVVLHNAAAQAWAFIAVA